MASTENKKVGKDQRDQQSEDAVSRAPSEENLDDPSGQETAQATESQSGDFANIHIGHQRESLAGSLDGATGEPFDNPSAQWSTEFTGLSRQSTAIDGLTGTENSLSPEVSELTALDQGHSSGVLTTPSADNETITFNVGGPIDVSYLVPQDGAGHDKDGFTNAFAFGAPQVAPAAHDGLDAETEPPATPEADAPDAGMPEAAAAESAAPEADAPEADTPEAGEPANNAPEVIEPVAAAETPEDATFSFDASAHFSDPDAGDTLTWTVDGPVWLTIDENGVLSGAPTNDHVGEISVTVTATDSSGASVDTSFTVTVDNVNDAPEATDIDDQGASEDASFSYDASVHFSDVDAGDSLSYAVSGPDWLSVESDGTLWGAPRNGDVGDALVTVTATDGSGESVSTSFTLTVANENDAPTVTAINEQSASEDAGFTYDASIHFSDVDAGDSLSYVVSGPHWLSVDADGTLSGTPQNGDSGEKSVTVTATDSSGESVSTTFILTVSNDNGIPTVTSIEDQGATEDASFTYDASAHFSEVGTGDDFSYSVSGPDWLSVDAGGNLIGTPDNGDVGNTSVTVTATGASGDSFSATFTLTVANENDAPTVTAINEQSASEDAGFTYDASAHFADVDAGDSLSYSIEGPDWLSVNADGTLFGTPENGDVGDASVTVTATDGSGESVSTSFTLTVANENDAPTASSIDSQQVEEASAFSYDASSHFSDLDVGDSLSYAIEGPDWLSIDEDGQISGTAPEDGDGDASVTVTATDAAGESVSTTFELSIASLDDESDDQGDDGLAASGEDDDHDEDDDHGDNDHDNEGLAASDENDFDDALPGGATSDGLTQEADIYVASDDGEVLNALQSDDIVYAQGGDDRMHGDGGDDTLYGQAGNDDLDGDNGNDVLYGGSGDDNLSGNNDDDTLYGGSGDDTLTGGNGADILIGGSGSDTATGGGGDDIFILSEGDDTGNSFAGGSGGAWTDAIEVTGADGSGSPDGAWTIVLEDGQTWEIDSDAGSLDLGDDMSGTITLGDGTSVDFSELERIEWGGGG